MSRYDTAFVPELSNVNWSVTWMIPKGPSVSVRFMSMMRGLALAGLLAFSGATMIRVRAKNKNGHISFVFNLHLAPLQ